LPVNERTTLFPKQSPEEGAAEAEPGVGGTVQGPLVKVI